MADDKKRRKKAAEPPQNDNNQEPIKEKPAEGKSGKTPRELWNDIPAADKEKIKAGDFVTDDNIIKFGDHPEYAAGEELTDEELLNYTLEELAAYKNLSSTLETEARSLTEQVTNLQELGVTDDSLSEYKDSLLKLTNTLQDLAAGYFGAIKNNIYLEIPALDAIRELVETFLSNDVIRRKIAEYEELKPYLNAELQKPQYKGRKFTELTREEQKEVETAAREAMAATPAQIKKVSTFSMLNNKISNEYMSLQDIFLSLQADGQLTIMPGALLDDGKAQVKVRNEIINKKTGNVVKPAVFSMAALSYTGDLEGKLARINGYDKSVLNAVCSLWIAGNRIITKEEIWYTLNPKNRRKTRPTKKQLARIDLALLRYSGTRIFLDLTNEINEKLINADGENVTPILNEQLLIYREYIFKSETGKTQSAIEILQQPVLLTYSLAKDNVQLVSIPMDWLELPAGLSAKEDIIVLRDYMLKEIKQLQTGNRDNNIFNYGTLLKQLELDENQLDRKEKGDVTEKITRLLDGFVQKGIIKEYHQRIGKKNKILGFEIVTNKQVKNQVP